jgi:hypothetical protein
MLTILKSNEQSGANYKASIPGGGSRWVTGLLEIGTSCLSLTRAAGETPAGQPPGRRRYIFLVVSTILCMLLQAEFGLWAPVRVFDSCRDSLRLITTDDNIHQLA